MTHKLGDWHDGIKLDVTGPSEPFGQIIGTRTKSFDGYGKEFNEVETLLITVDGQSLGEQLFDAYDAGFEKGREAGFEEAQDAMRKAIGIWTR